MFRDGSQTRSAIRAQKARERSPAACWAPQVKSSQVSQERLFAVGLDVVLRVVATLLWTPVDLFESAQQAAVEDLAFQDLPERARESTCSSSDAHSEGQNRVGSVRVPLGGGRGWYGLAADEWRRALEVPRSGSVTAGPSRMEPSMFFFPVVLFWALRLLPTSNKINLLQKKAEALSDCF